MNLLRSLLALVFAIVIANPACCCTVKKVDEPVKTSHCCGGTKQEKKQAPEHCLCAAKNPKLQEDPPVIPAFTALELPPILPSFGELIVPEVPAREVAAVDFHHDAGPPLRRLALLQRFLI
ncbi:hypothetical protein [Luteolibacter luteus]|uniref:Uncharacterized protein n=1 Tax=Luteolibacter luteus TaxID=2728835 RepID=A0A858RJV9_9BACT|nr:hypothetical protein [Luteolibacter luteus]QJE96689.1 hypothetical protein HHL09_13155 [Luteolibacter luteus]